MFIFSLAINSDVIQICQISQNLTLIRGLVKCGKVINKMNKEVWALRQAKRESPKFKVARYCNESMFGIGIFVQLDVVVTTMELKCYKVFCSF